MRYYTLVLCGCGTGQYLYFAAVTEGWIHVCTCGSPSRTDMIFAALLGSQIHLRSLLAAALEELLHTYLAVPLAD